MTTSLPGIWSSRRQSGAAAGYNWTIRTNPSTSINWGVAYGNSYWNIASQTTESLYSSNGTSWTKVTQSINAARGCSYGNGYHIVHGDAGFVRYSSGAPPSTWTSATYSNYSYILGSCYCGATIKWIGCSYTGYIIRRDSTTPNGTWTSPAHPVTTPMRFVAMGSSYAVAVGDSGKIYRSSDGTTWNSVTSGFGTDDITGVAYGNSYFVAVGASGKLSYSTNDGSSWTLNTSTTIPSASFLHCVAYDSTKNRWVCAGNSGVLYTTSGNDPTGAWSSETSGFGTSGIYAINYGNGYLVITGADSKIATSFS